MVDMPSNLTRMDSMFYCSIYGSSRSANYLYSIGMCGNKISRNDYAKNVK